MSFGFSLSRSNFFDFTSFVHNQKPITPIPQNIVTVKENSINHVRVLPCLAKVRQIVASKNQNLQEEHKTLLRQANGYSHIAIFDKIKPLVLSPITKVNPPNNHLFKVSQRNTTCKNGALCQPCQLANKPMNWNFHCPTIIQGINDSVAINDIILKTNCGVDLVARISGGYQANSLSNIPTFDLVENAIANIGAIETSIIVVPPFQVLDASLEAIASGSKQLIIVTPHVPPLDTIKILQKAKSSQTLVLGPGSAGIIQPPEFCLGTLQEQYFQPGNIGIIGYSQTLIYEVAWALNQQKIGQSWAIALGQDKILGSNLFQWLTMLNQDEQTKAIILIQSAQDMDNHALDFLATSINKPVICYLIGMKTPLDRVLRNSRDILSHHLSNSIPAANSAQKNLSIIKKNKAILANNPSEIAQLIGQILTECKPETTSLKH